MLGLTTVTQQESLYVRPPVVIVAVTVAEPAPTAVTRPLLLTEATLESLLLQLTLSPLGEVLADKYSLSPTAIDRLESKIRTLTSITETEQLSE